MHRFHKSFIFIRLMLFVFVFVVLVLIPSFSSQRLTTTRSDYDIFGKRFVLNDHVVALADNHLTRYHFFFYPFGPENYCSYDYLSSHHFLVSLSIGERQTADDLSFVYLRTDEDAEDSFELGTFSIDRTQCSPDSEESPLSVTKIHRFEMSHDGFVSILQVDFDGQYAYGFLEQYVYILDIDKKNVTIFDWETILPNVTKFYPKDAQITRIRSGVDLIVLIGYLNINGDGTLPKVYLFHAEPPFRLTLLDNETLVTHPTVGEVFAERYEFDYVMSVSIEQETQQILIALPSYKQTLLYEFNETNLFRRKVFPEAARSVNWFEGGTQAVMLLADIPTLPWASSQIQVINTTTTDLNIATLYAIPNNQQTIPFATPTQLVKFIRLGICQGHPILLTSDGLIIHVPIAPPGHYFPLVEISSTANPPNPCPNGTFRTTFSPSPCLVCPTGYRNSKFYLNFSF